jgi:hypothetical protein
MYVGLRVKYPLVLSDFNETLIFPTFFSRNTRVSNFTKILPAEEEFCEDGQTDGQTDVTEANTRFLQFCERT